MKRAEPHSPLVPTRGFALVVAVFAISLISAVVMGGYVVASRQFRAGGAALAVGAALYSAEAGLQASLAAWEPAEAAELAPGATVALSSGTLASGDAYEAWLTRLDGGQDARAAYYLIRSVGLASGPRGGRRQVGLLLRSQSLDSVCCAAAIVASGEVAVVEGGHVDGNNVEPDPWGSGGGGGGGGGSESVCNDERTPGPGIVLAETGQLVNDGEGLVEGQPPLLSSGPLADEVLAGAREIRARLLDRADKRYPAGSDLPELRPAMDPRGGCLYDAADNWGAPQLVDHPCSQYFPIIYVPGDLTLLEGGTGQGVLIVDGNLDIGNGFEFYGPVLLSGRLSADGPGTKIHGSVVAIGLQDNEIRLAQGAGVIYSHCAVQRALASSKLNQARPLAQRAWLEIFK